MVETFYSLQQRAHAWAADVCLGEMQCQDIVEDICSLFDSPVPTLLFEQPALCHPSQAVTVQNPRTGGLTVAFSGSGTDLLTLCHEMAHVVRPFEEDFHDELDWDLTSMMLEILRYDI